MLRIAILGAGAMGSIFGAELTSHGHDTLLVDSSEPLVARLGEAGVTIRREGDERTVPVTATTQPDGAAPADLLIVFVKSWATRDALELAGSLLGERTIVLTLQNGWGNAERIAETVDRERILVGVTYHSGTVAGLGVVEHTAAGTTYLGAADGGSPAAAAEVAAALSAAGLACEADDDILTRIWRKLMLNLAANPVAALTGLRSGALREEPHVDALMRGLLQEAVRVAQAEGVALEEEETVAYVRESLRFAGPATASMRQDVLAGRRTEIDVITGALLDAARRHGVETPLNVAIYALVKGYEAALEPWTPAPAAA